MTLNKDSYQIILNIKKLKNGIITSAALVEIRKIFFSHNFTISNQKYILTRAN